MSERIIHIEWVRQRDDNSLTALLQMLGDTRNKQTTATPQPTHNKPSLITVMQI